MRTPRDTKMNAFSWKDFTVTGKSLVTEASDLYLARLNGKGLPVYEDDTKTMGIPVRGKHGDIWFAYAKTEVDEEGDIKFWEYRVIPEHVRANRALKDWKLIVFND